MAQTSSTGEADTFDSICITRLHEHSHGGLASGSLEHFVSPVSIDLGGPHTISTALASKLLEIGLDELDALVKIKRHIVHVDWRYETPNPKFTTRHLVIAGSFPMIAFAGGTQWFENVARTSVFRGEQETMPIPDDLRDPAWITPLTSRKPSLNTGPQLGNLSGLQHTCRQEPNRWARALSPPELSDTSRTVSPDPEDDQLSNCSDTASTGSAFSEATAPRIYTPAPSRQNSSSLADINGAWMDCQIQQQFQSEAFQQQRKQAEDLYMRTGDVSGLIGVIKTASQFSQSGSSTGAFGP
ncbi:uncharacterized protein PODANS_4_7100 [Podospora anserina S mat+]|uniref:Podospora anserina S mat+ genomic DNA chromosome 4, supercontig 4 n=1 Tax=Podospora anserina (strain S / ATCC MYA-4624 / DSM 980 / FGSC 10383) TaxID=515849 RepID=B2ARL6_PODAN|nr:uncharacterized protein PODANS_4_7100 [Podospora anserina S mat+]CAP66794.1 unnamed protein product [Podospora anserina S mat+]CDP28534.1 Putative protein of unknown function [Podospora anserina S mat+]